MKLHAYWRSSASYRVRIALNLKGLAYETVPVDLKAHGGAQHSDAFLRLNPNGRVPALELDDGTVLTQSLAIIEWLEESFASPPLLPADPIGRARARALAELVAADIQPQHNLSTLRRLKREHGFDEPALAAWTAFWVTRGLGALEAEVAAHPPADGGRFAFGVEPSVFEVMLVPQLYHARLNGVDVGPFPRLQALDDAARSLSAFAAAAPELQPDAPPATG